jgi:hypothetical protein
MTIVIRMHELAMARGDGLRPELLALLRRRAAIENDPAITELDAIRGGLCAGPPPLGSATSETSTGVLRFPGPAAASDQQTRPGKDKRCT